MKFSYLFLAAALFCGACSKDRKAPNGFDVKVVREGEGSYAAPGQFLVMNMLYKDSKDSVWNDTRKKNIPVVILVQDTANMKNEKGMESSFRILKKGDSVILKVTAKSLFENTWGQQVPPNVKPESELSFFLGVTDITDQAGVTKIQEAIQVRENEKNKKLMEGQQAADSIAIEAYLTSHNIQAQKAANGLRYVITKQGKGDAPTMASTVKVNYKGSLMENGQIFDQSQTPIEYPLANFIQGWQIGFQLLNRGTKATLFIPSSLGYGLNGAPPDIPANANLIFEVELIDFK